MFSVDNKGAVNNNNRGDIIYWDGGWTNLNDGGNNHKVAIVGELDDATQSKIADAVAASEPLLIARQELNEYLTYFKNSYYDQWNGNPDYKVQKGEVVKAIVTLQNIGHGEANNVRYTISTSNPNVYLMTESGTVNSLSGSIDNFLAGEAKEIAFRLSANNNYQHVEEYLPIYITVHEDKGYGDIVSSIIPIPLGTTPAKPNIVDIQGERDKLFAQQQTKVYSSSNRISSNIKIRDISIAPAGDPIYKNAIAIVIGAEKNSYGVAPAPYAARDAQVMAKYFETSMGIQDVQLITNEQVTGNALSDIFDPSFGYLKSSVKPGQTDVFVYYSGHGMPDGADNGSQDV